ncbi:hypothetical protein ACP4OV_008516 [Aristida adscensionis]
MAENKYKREQAEKACKRAEELFLIGHVREAHRVATGAARLCPSLAAVASAVAAYEVYAAAAARPGDWRAVLGVPGDGAVAPDAVKKHFRRLSLLVHPDKNSCAAAEGAFELVRQARDALESESGGAGEPQPWWTEREWKQHNRRRAEAQRARRRRPPAQASSTPYKVIYCPFCKSEFARPCGPLQERAGMMCEDCRRWLSPPWQKKPAPPAKAAASAAAPAKPKPPVFPCPAQCPDCGAQYASKVSVGQWCLQCKACSKRAMVNVQGPDLATVGIKRLVIGT